MRLCSFLLGACLLVAIAATAAAAVPPQGASPTFEKNVLELLRGAQEQTARATAVLNAQQQAEESRFASSVAKQMPIPSSLLDTGANLAQSMASLISSQQQENQASFKSLLVEQKQHEAVKSEISSQRKVLRERAVFLERMQSCIADGPLQDKLDARARELMIEDGKLDKEFAALIESGRSHRDKDHSLISREEFLHRKDSVLSSAAARSKQSLSLLEQRSQELAKHESAIREAEEELQARAAALNAREEALVARQAALTEEVASMRMQQQRFTELHAETREHVYLAEADGCEDLTACGACIKNSKCGWCASSADGSQGKCLSHNVNAASDGLSSGQCPLNGWRSKVTDRLNAMNLNVFGADYLNKEQRAAAMFNTIISAKFPDFVAFQEVQDWFLALLKLQPWFTKYYHLTYNNATSAPGGLAILSRFPLMRTVYSEQAIGEGTTTDARPRVLTTHVSLNDKIISIATTTLDWRNPDSRVAGLTFLKAVTEPLENLLLLADLNFDEGSEPETSALSPTWLDVWPRLHNTTADPAVAASMPRGPNRYGFTWDPVTNQFARFADPNARPSRIDRIFVRSTILLPRSIWLVGCPGPDYLCQDPPSPLAPKPGSPFQATAPPETSGPLIFPSPHYGLLSTFSVFTPYC